MRTAALDLHEGLSPNGANEGSTCARWPRAMRLASSGGKLVPGRCRATNLCDYCARLSAVEWSEMLALDALDGDAPAVWLVLTTPRADADPAAFYEARRQLVRAIRERFAGARYLCITEFTTGYGPRSGGLRRPHFNVLVKGVPATDEALTALRGLVEAHWCRLADAHMAGQHVGYVSEAGGLMRYLGLHFLKESQRPPEGWSGQRVTFSTSRGRNGGYFTRPVWQVRRDAQRALKLKREVWRAERAGWTGDDALAVAELELERLEHEVWTAVRLTVDGGTGEVTGARPVQGRRDGPLYEARRARVADRRLRVSVEIANYDRERDEWEPIPDPIRAQLAFDM